MLTPGDLILGPTFDLVREQQRFSMSFTPSPLACALLPPSFLSSAWICFPLSSHLSPLILLSELNFFVFSRLQNGNNNTCLVGLW